LNRTLLLTQKPLLLKRRLSSLKKRLLSLKKLLLRLVMRLPWPKLRQILQKKKAELATEEAKLP